MAGHELVTEGFKAGQVGSCAMPHKMNTRSCERVNGLAVVLRGHLSMVSELAGDQWNEGDVSCSVVRRVALPDAFFAIDGLFETFLTVLDEFGVFPAVVPARARPLPAVPGHHQGADGRGPAGRRPRDRPRGDQGARGRGGARDARGARPTTTCSTGSRPTRGSASTAADHRRPGGATRSSSPVRPARPDGRRRTPGRGGRRPPPRTPRPTPRRDPLTRAGGRSRAAQVAQLRGFLTAARRPSRDAATSGHPPSSRSSFASIRSMSAFVADTSSGRRSTTIVPPGSSLTWSTSATE